MKTTYIYILFFVVLFGIFGFIKMDKNTDAEYTSIDELRKAYSSGDYSKWPKPVLDPSIDKKKFKDIGVLPKVEFPKDNPYSEAKAKLGKMLFFDPRLSSSGQIACVSCHNPELAWTDNLTRAFGHNRQNSKRNSMTILNVAFAKPLFWDGRAKSLEDQSIFPIQDALEMNEHIEVAVDKINKIEGYQKLFAETFEDKKVSLINIQKAIATFERTIVSNESKFDKFISGKPDVFSDEEVLGLHLYRTKANCISCHNTPYFSDNEFHNDGQTLFGTKDEDFGRYNVTKNKSDIGKFRTPTLREAGRTGPWMHHGHFPSLLDVIQFYNLGNPSPIQKKYIGTVKDSLIPKNSPILKKLDLSKDEIKSLIAFINTLSTPIKRMEMPDLPK
jgi:cytochrome c peroxidase